MMIKKTLYATILTAIFPTLFVSQAFATTYTIMVFAPKNYAGCICSTGPNGAQPKPFFGYASPTGHYSDDGIFGGFAVGPQSLKFAVDTYWYLYNGTTTTLASVSASAWMMYGISGSAGFRAWLEVYRWRPGSSIILWTNYYHPASVWSDSVPGWKTRAMDLEIDPYDTGTGGNRFNLTYGYYYRAVMYVWGYAKDNSSSVAVETGEFKEITFHSQGSEWIIARQQLFVYPPITYDGDFFDVFGTGFAPNSLVYIYYDGGLVNKTTSDGSGNFITSFGVNETVKGPHIVLAMDALENQCTAVVKAVVPSIPLFGDITGGIVGVPDGKVDMKDIGYVCLNFGKTDPNVDPPGTALGWTSFVKGLITTLAISPLCVFAMRRKKSHDNRVSENRNKDVIKVAKDHEKNC